MIVKNILEVYSENKIRIEFLEKQLEFINKNIDDIEAVQLTEKTGITNKVNNNIENKYIKKEIEVEKIINEIKFIKYEIELAEFFIRAAKTEEEKEILIYKYKKGWGWNEIAKKVNLSRSGVRMKVDRILKKIDEIVDLSNMKHEREIVVPKVCYKCAQL